MPKPPQNNGSSFETTGTFNLASVGEDSFISQDSQNPSGARRVLAMIPSISGELRRELGQAKYLPTQLTTKVTSLFQYEFNDGSGNKQTVRFASTSDLKLWIESGGAWIQQTLPTIFGLTATAPLLDTPQYCVINNLLHIADGTSNWIYDGPNAHFVIEGLPAPLHGPGVVSVAGAGNITANVSRFYWFTYADQTAGRVHESSTSPIDVSGGTGVVASKAAIVTCQQDTIGTTLGSFNVTSTGASFVADFVGQTLYVGGVSYGTIDSFVDASNMGLHTAAPANNVAQPYLIVPPRTTHVHFYCSETDGSKLGKFLVSMPVTQSPPQITDSSFFIDNPASTITNVDRPIRNDPPAASRIVEVHKYRIFRRRESKPNFFFFSANEEVSAGNGNGSPQESYPGAAGALTRSDIVDEKSYPQESNRLRAIKSHNDALWLATEKGIIPLYGESIDDFSLMQVVTITGGALSRWSMESTPHGLVIMGYDRLLRLYPPISPVYAAIPQEINITDQLVELGRPMRKKFKAIKNADQDNVKILHYQFNERDWLVVCLQDSSNTYHTYVYDFATKGWFESQRGFVCVAVFEPVAGEKILVGGGTDGFVYVMDDLSGTFTNATCPAALFRTALVNFARPDIMHEPFSLEFEVSNPNLAQDISVNFYLDPQDADNPGVAFGPMNMSLVPGSAARYRGYFAATGGVQGVICKRLLVEFSIASSTNSGALRGVLLKAFPADAEIV